KRISNSQLDRDSSRKVPLWRQSFKTSNKTARDDWHICFCDQHPQAVLERHHRASAAAPAFRKNDEDRFFFLQFLAQISEGVWPPTLSPHRQRVKHDCRKRTGHLRLKKHIARGNREGTFAMPGDERCSKSECVEMTAMICREHKRSMCR